MSKRKRIKIISVVGARPQFIKLCPMVEAIRNRNQKGTETKIQHLIVHTGQHYDFQMSKVFFNELGIYDPDYNLEVGSSSHGWQTGEMMRRVEQVFVQEKPDFVLIYGDTNSTLAGALVSAKMGITSGHVEAGLRSFNRRMPEEINRVLADHCADILFCPTENACRNLKKEGMSNIFNSGKLIEGKLHKPSLPRFDFPAVINVGDIMYDMVLLGLEKAEKKSKILERLGLKPKQYYLATTHRVENADNQSRLEQIIEALDKISEQKTVIFPIHPRTEKNLARFQIALPSPGLVRMIKAVSYFDMLVLEKNAEVIFTDSGGMQKEAFFFNVPCVTFREETEWPETLESGNNTLSGADKQRIINSLSEALSKQRNYIDYMPFGDGHTADRILRIIFS